MPEKDYGYYCSLCNKEILKITIGEMGEIFFIVCQDCRKNKKIRQKLTRIRYDYNTELDHHDGYRCPDCGAYLHPVENHVIGICGTCEPEKMNKWMKENG